MTAADAPFHVPKPSPDRRRRTDRSRRLRSPSSGAIATGVGSAALGQPARFGARNGPRLHVTSSRGEVIRRLAPRRTTLVRSQSAPCTTRARREGRRCEYMSPPLASPKRSRTRHVAGEGCVNSSAGGQQSSRRLTPAWPSGWNGDSHFRHQRHTSAVSGSATAFFDPRDFLGKSGLDCSSANPVCGWRGFCSFQMSGRVDG
jgi:hypothetical protein